MGGGTGGSLGNLAGVGDVFRICIGVTAAGTCIGTLRIGIESGIGIRLRIGARTAGIAGVAVAAPEAGVLGASIVVIGTNAPADEAVS